MIVQDLRVLSFGVWTLGRPQSGPFKWALGFGICQAGDRLARQQIWVGIPPIRSLIEHVQPICLLVFVRLTLPHCPSPDVLAHASLSLSPNVTEAPLLSSKMCFLNVDDHSYVFFRSTHYDRAQSCFIFHGFEFLYLSNPASAGLCFPTGLNILIMFFFLFAAKSMCLFRLLFVQLEKVVVSLSLIRLLLLSSYPIFTSGCVLTTRAFTTLWQEY